MAELGPTCCSQAGGRARQAAGAVEAEPGRWFDEHVAQADPLHSIRREGARAARGQGGRRTLTLSRRAHEIGVCTATHTPNHLHHTPGRALSRQDVFVSVDLLLGYARILVGMLPSRPHLYVGNFEVWRCPTRISGLLRPFGAGPHA
eukprot:4070281-Prymnesium_polylepis.1